MSLAFVALLGCQAWAPTPPEATAGAPAEAWEAACAGRRDQVVLTADGRYTWVRALEGPPLSWIRRTGRWSTLPGRGLGRRLLLEGEAATFQDGDPAPQVAEDPARPLQLVPVAEVPRVALAAVWEDWTQRELTCGLRSPDHALAEGVLIAEGALTGPLWPLGAYEAR